MPKRKWASQLRQLLGARVKRQSATVKRITLAELLADMKPERQHKADDDPPRGAELL